MIYNVVITTPAENDLREIGRYISKELLEPESAQKVIGKIADAIINLEHMPYRNALVHDTRLAKMGIRHLLVGNYIVFYTVIEDRRSVTIIRMLYNKRNWQNLL
ncbi:toxin ParE1/3/4 [Virgibacillus natechei]|uniref:Toxin ParE1/3/4 n=1 Tax=Virgibacillus natechei TaxID=1216297 RepID=A0ABS4IGM1_9BACI|nr:type II toxin-antitoxin system RelE/ParE family toxin [Virgibacillus natechei]MBP1970084.1 toxin ParE1/3/4 [Virgibacillus natechei]UZD14164.1 type II toxin-antitoxin system RelE/ParE family toxin [Virgibacillus natechei]